MSQIPALFEEEPAALEPLGPTGRPWPDLPEVTPPQRLPGHRALVIAMTNQKGGVG